MCWQTGFELEYHLLVREERSMSIKGIGKRVLRRRSNKLILVYHKISDEKDCNGLAVSSSNFKEHIRVLQETSQVVSYSEILKSKDARTERLAAITFDDGYAGLVDHAWPVLEKDSIPWTIFVNGAWILGVEGENAIRPWWDNMSNSYGSICESVSKEIHAVNPTVVERTLEALGMVEGEWSDRRDDHFLNADNIRQLARQKMISIENHGMQHRWLGSLSKAEQMVEIGLSDYVIHSLTGQKPLHYCYAYGDRKSFNGDTYSVLRSFGYHSACTVMSYKDRLGLPRNQCWKVPRMIVRDYDGKTLKKYIELWESSGRWIDPYYEDRP